MFDKHAYPANWPAMRAAVKARSGNRCERCGVWNHAVGARDRAGVWHDDEEIAGMNDTGLYVLFGRLNPAIIRIVCTTAHRPGTSKMSTDLGDLEFLCQRDHLGQDRAHHMATARETRARKRGMASLFEARP